MSAITVSNLTFSYDNGWENIFENVSFIIDTDWKLGLIGRNGKGKTTLMKLLTKQEQYQGSIKASVDFDYFPFKVENPNLYTYEIIGKIHPDYEEWQIQKEITLLDMQIEVLYRPFKTLSMGEQTKIMLATLFTKKNNFLLIDEPTNHLDYYAREIVAKYLKSKKGFILISHDRAFLDTCVDHIMSINRTNIDIQQGNFSTWWENKSRQDSYERQENDRLTKDIKRLQNASKQTSTWANKVEASKYHAPTDRFIDKGYIGHKSSKMMQKVKNIQSRIQTEIDKKSTLLKNVESTEELKIKQVDFRKNPLLYIKDLCIEYDNKRVVNNLSFEVEKGDRILLQGKNGSGKSSVIKLILGKSIPYTGQVSVPHDLKISYVSQEAHDLKGDLKTYISDKKIDETLLKTILRKFDFSKEHFDIHLENYSEGQKKKFLIALSLCEQANIFVWDEPLNYIDIFSRMQLEEMLQKYNPTMIFVEHDKDFANAISTKVIKLTD